MDIKLVALDIDGVLTDGRLQYGPDGEETKTFHVKDGAAIKRLMQAGIDVCWITARGSDAVACRAKELGVQKLYMKVSNKLEVLENVVEELGINFSEVCYVGDDTIDMECMSRAGLAVAPADAIQKVREIADFCTDAKGGHGVVAEVGDTLLNSGASDEDGFHVVIPARFGASRLVGKPLLDLAGKTMIQWVYQKATGSRAKSVVVATDHEGIRDSAAKEGARVVMTDSELRSGTDRVAAVCEAMELKDTDIVVNLQGDEPLMPSEAIDLVAQDLISHKEAHISTLAVPLKDDEYTNPNAVKVVTDHDGYGLYFSRAPIPAVRGGEGQPKSIGKRHLGIYAYRVGALKAITKAKPAELEKLESLEQLRALSMGLKIHVTTWKGYVPHGIDSEDDIAKVVAELKPAKIRGK